MQRKTKRNMSLHPLLLNSTYEAGNAIGPILAYSFSIAIVVEICYVWVKYVITSNK